MDLQDLKDLREHPAALTLDANARAPNAPGASTRRTQACSTKGALPCAAQAGGVLMKRVPFAGFLLYAHAGLHSTRTLAFTLPSLYTHAGSQSTVTMAWPTGAHTRLGFLQNFPRATPPRRARRAGNACN